MCVRTFSLVLVASLSVVSCMTADDTTALNKHNEYRSGVASASNMVDMTWDANLASVAQGWATACTAGHNPNRDTEAGEIVGENIATGTTMTTEKAITYWYDEVQHYTYGATGGTCAANQVCGHYTQVVWAKSVRLGCGSASCPGLGGTRVVCNYAPPGNYIDQPPYLLGAKCSACPAATPNCTTTLNLCYNANAPPTTAPVTSNLPLTTPSASSAVTVASALTVFAMFVVSTIAVSTL